MKKLTAVIICIATALSLIGCGSTDLPAETIEKKDYSEFAGIVADPTTWLEEFEALPIANENMTTDELRQLACDAFKANMTFQWTPNQPIIYTYYSSSGDKNIYLPSGQAYSGFCYAIGINEAKGTLYKILPYYDKETGVVDIEAMGDHMLNIITSACAFGAQQGWNRVSCTHGKVGMHTFNPYLNSSISLVGPYTYQPHHYNHDFTTRTCTQEIIAVNSEQIMYESYACALPADGFYNGAHVLMCSIKPVVVRNADGTINGDESYLHVHEQGAYGTNREEYDVLQSNGVKIRMMGTIDNKYTFKQLLESSYIPFTFKVFTGEEKVQPGKAWVGDHVGHHMENGQDLTLTVLFGKKLYTNYALCTVEVVVKNPKGEELVHYYPIINTSPITYETGLIGALQKDRLTPYANGKNTVHIYARLSNGELVEAYQTILKAD